MKIELDYDNKVIKLENKTELKNFVETIQNILPDWEEWTLDTNTTINWSNPIVIDRTSNPYIPIQPWWEKPYVWCGPESDVYYGEYTINSTNQNEPVSGKYQIEIK